MLVRIYAEDVEAIGKAAWAAVTWRLGLGKQCAILSHGWRIRVEKRFSIYQSLDVGRSSFLTFHIKRHVEVGMGDSELTSGEKTQVVALCGSSREGGATEALLQRLLRRFTDRGMAGELIVFYWKTIYPCVGCMNCQEMQNGSCCLEDDFAEVYRAMCKADIVLLGSSSLHKPAPGFVSFLQRVERVVRSHEFELSGKVGTVVSGGRPLSRRKGDDWLVTWAFRQGMILVGFPGQRAGKGGGRRSETDWDSVLLDRMVDRLLEVYSKCCSGGAQARGDRKLQNHSSSSIVE